MIIVKIFCIDNQNLQKNIEILNAFNFVNIESFSIDDFYEFTDGMPEELVEYKKIVSLGKYYIKYYIEDDLEKFLEFIKANLIFSEYEISEISSEKINEFLELKHEINIDNKIVITSSNRKLEFNPETVIKLVPGVGFGTGEHETTYECMRAMLEIKNEFESVLDIGCGSGILSILAYKFGCKIIDGFDIDNSSIENALDNCKINNSKCNLFTYNIFDFKPQKKYDLVVANIYADVLVNSYDIVYNSSKNYILLSGIIDYKWDMVKSVFNKNCDIVKLYKNKEWVTVLLKINNP